ncbi:LysR family transcriptional regulator [Oribacterium sp. WCC10]|uniref:LysR family transcriptional regulator n=1 Tax=Oribacterium sp. WCC10 TaxID=1855343 RepID=UPI0008E22377|nr:LysR family transcriptional regulator [Oribacterium sp. WCC10]SFG33602.1 DNA-binding transcriptional regulator, LysR family [Oribacterium sp. WCC10]
MISYDYYRIFYYVGTYKSFTQAARMLGSNQPNVSRAMTNLEESLGCKLMQRGKRGITLTQNGQRLYEHVIIAFEQLEEGERELDKDVNLESGQVTIAASENALRLVLLPVLHDFKSKYPDISIRISNHATPKAIKSLQNGSADFALVTTPLTIREPLTMDPLFHFKEIPIVGPGFKHLTEKPISLRELNKYPIISVGRETGTRELYVQYFLNHQLTFQPELEASSTDQILPMVENDLGCGFYPEDLAKDALERGLVYRVPILEPIPDRTFCLLIDRSRNLSSAAIKLIDTFVKETRI